MKHRAVRTLLAATLAVSLPAAAAAQDEDPGPEGMTWHLASYVVDDAIVPVPLGVDATLLLEEGAATGSGGCNTFTGSYLLEGDSLQFGEEVVRTLAACEGDPDAVEAGYLTSLPQVEWWALQGEVLELSDEDDSVILRFEQPLSGLTASDLAAILTTLDEMQVQIDDLRADVRDQQVNKLRKRVTSAENELKKLKDQVGKQKAAPKTPPKQQTSLTSGEDTLLEAIPGRISSTCSPLRSSLPAGTKAALTCKPNTQFVRTLRYYLLDGEDASRDFEARMSQYDVREALTEQDRCIAGKKGRVTWIGQGYVSEGCYRDSKKKAQLRYLEFATDCRVLRVDGERLEIPTVYVSLVGTNNDIARLTRWATKGDDPTGPSSLVDPLVRPNNGWSPACPQ